MKLWWFGKNVWTSNRNITVPEDAWQIAMTCSDKENSPFFSTVSAAEEKREEEWLMVNLSAHRVPVTCDTSTGTKSRFRVCNFAFFQWLQRKGVKLSSKSEGFQIMYRYWPAWQDFLYKKFHYKSHFSTRVLKIGHEPAFLIDHK